MVFKLHPIPAITWIGKASWLSAHNRSDDEPLIFMPANRIENILKWNLEHVLDLPDAFLSLSGRHVMRQNRVPDRDGDYAPPPEAYTLFGIEGGARIPWGRQTLFAGFTISNLFNTTYRDYLNRFRYYADEPGRNVSLRFQFQF